MLGDPGEPLPPTTSVDLDAFWVRFDAAAPAHLALGFKVATLLIAVVLPRLMGHASGLAGLDADAADAVVQRAARLPLLNLVTEVAKIVSCFAYFADDDVQAVVRGGR